MAEPWISESSVSRNLDKLTSGIKDFFFTATRDFQPVNHALQEIVDSGNTMNATGDHRTAFEVESFKQTVRERLVSSTGFTKAVRNLANFASDDMLLKSIKDDLSRKSCQKLKSYLSTLKERIASCHKSIDQLQPEYSHVHELVQKHSKRIAQVQALAQNKSNQGGCIAGSCVAGVAGFIVTRIVIDSVPLTDSSISHPSDHSSVCEYLLCLLIGIMLGASYFYIARRFGFHQPQVQTQYRSMLDPGFAILQSAEKEIPNFLPKLHNMKSRLLEMEQCLIKISEYYTRSTLDIEDIETIKSQLDKLQQEMKDVLNFVN